MSLFLIKEASVLAHSAVALDSYTTEYVGYMPVASVQVGTYAALQWHF